MVVSRDEFVRNLRDSGLFSADEAARLLAACPASADDGDKLASSLTAAGKLTEYQATALRERRLSELLIGNYEILQRLGAGGMGTVFKARHRRMKRLVALKILSPDVAREASFVQRFQREVETIAQLTHPNIVMAFDADEDHGTHFLVMEFVNGRDLATEVLQNGPLSVAEAVNCVHQAALGLQSAHAQGIVHRDIKPANLLRDATGAVKVADLGLARLNTPGTAANSSLTQAGGILGTADFMAPEQAVDSTSIDQRVDIYSLGCTLYFLLVGEPPYVAGSLMALLLKHRDAPIPSLRTARPEVVAELDAIFQRMVAKKPEDRFPDMAAVVDVLDKIRSVVSPFDRRPGPKQTHPATEPGPTDVTVAADSLEQLTSSTVALTPPSDAARVADLTVVLVEPSRTQAGIVRKWLQELGIQKIHNTGAGQQAVALAREKGADVIVSTMHLSDMTGVQLAELLHADAASSRVGFVLTSSEADTTEAAAILGVESRVLLPKPFDLRQLAKALAQATGRVM